MTEQSQPSYYAVIPACVRYCKSLCPSAKLLYGEITALCNDKGYCFATNNYFADLYETQTTTVSRWIRQLADNGFIAVEIDKQSGNKRKITLRETMGDASEKSQDLLSKIARPIVKNRNSVLSKKAIGIVKKSNTPIVKKSNTPIDKNVNDTIYNSNSFSNNTFNNLKYNSNVDFFQNQPHTKIFEKFENDTVEPFPDQTKESPPLPPPSVRAMTVGKFRIERDDISDFLKHGRKSEREEWFDTADSLIFDSRANLEACFVSWMQERKPKAAVEKKPDLWEKIKSMPPPPDGESYGDGELRYSCIEYAKKNEGKYAKEMYVAFLRYWTATTQRGQKELWRTKETWDLSGRLATWKSNDNKNNQPYQKHGSTAINQKPYINLGGSGRRPLTSLAVVPRTATTSGANTGGNIVSETGKDSTI